MERLDFIVMDSPIGPLTIVTGPGGLSQIRFGPSEPDGGVRSVRATATVVSQLNEYFNGRRQTFDLELAPRDTAFQQAVWRALVEIPYGETSSYGSIAGRIGRPGAGRAVGAANNRNPIPIIIPCHRVIGAGGELTGYAGGLQAKARLLELEGAVMTKEAPAASHARGRTTSLPFAL